MTCPFPGMDPYLEMQPFWGDFHPQMLVAISHSLLPKLLPKYDVQIEEYIFVTREDMRLHRVQPDLAISTFEEPRGGKPATAVLESTAVEMEYPDFEPRRQRRLRLIHRATGEVVTVIELLSPANKALLEDGFDAYLEKRSELLAARCQLIEIDLLRGGMRLPMAGALPPGDYYVYVGRAARKPRGQVLAWSLRAPLPTISVPLLPEDPEVPLDLQAAFKAAYEPSLYDRRLPYKERLVPPLPPDDQKWVEEQLARHWQNRSAAR